MFARKEKPLPVAVLKPEPTKNTQSLEDEGIHLGEGYWGETSEDTVGESNQLVIKCNTKRRKYRKRSFPAP